MSNVAELNQNYNTNVVLMIRHKLSNGYVDMTPIVEDGIKWETERKGTPSKLTFRVYMAKNDGLVFEEGDMVALKSINDKSLFSGYIFTKKQNKDGWVDVTAYDQLRYLKNKATYVFTKKRASDLVKMIAQDFKLHIGNIQSTPYVIGERVEDNQSLFDIIQNALDLTLIHTGKQYFLYDENNKLYLKDMATNNTLSTVITNSTAEDFEYSSSIDEETYNEIELYYDNKETNKREYYNEGSASTINRWGVLRYTESIQNPTNAKNRAKKMLELYNRKTKKLKVKGAFGDPNARAGKLIPVELDLGDTKISNAMVIEKATHTFSHNNHTMDLTLSDGVFTA